MARSGWKLEFPLFQGLFSVKKSSNKCYEVEEHALPAGFFTFFSDTQEQDIEFLSSDPDYYQRLHYTNQPGQLDNGDVDPDSQKDVEVPVADFTTFGVHRFDWLPAATTYSYDGTSDGGNSVKSSTTVTKNVPTTPSSSSTSGAMAIPTGQFSRGPPTADAVATLKYVNLYFNSTTLSAAPFGSQCSAAGNIAPCNV